MSPDRDRDRAAEEAARLVRVNAALIDQQGRVAMAGVTAYLAAFTAREITALRLRATQGRLAREALTEPGAAGRMLELLAAAAGRAADRQVSS